MQERKAIRLSSGPRMASNLEINDCLPTKEYSTVTKASTRSYEIVYLNVLVMCYYHIAGFYGFYLCYSSAMWTSIIFTYVTFWLAGAGVIAGSHRLWAHRSYKAKTPLQVFLMLCHSLANQHTVVHWVRDHRLHHKFSDTDADPHNASRGLFFSHVGWLLVRKHPEVIERGKLIDVSDLLRNPVLTFQHKNGSWFIPLISIVVPTLIPLAWGETLNIAWHLNLARYIINLNMTFMINSFSHTWGYRPFDKAISPAQNKAMFIMTLGEGFHNFHHVFPCDYRSDELGSVFNSMALFIEGCAKLGLAYDLKTVPKKVLRSRIKRSGDGSHPWAVEG